MKTFLMFVTVAAISTLTVGAQAKEGDTHEKIVPINDVYVPSGFDSSSESFVVVNGLFPNSCYKVKDARVDHIGPTLHQVRTYANVTEGLCLTVLVPFHKEVQLGRLSVGDHKIHFMDGDGTYMEKRLVIEN